MLHFEWARSDNCTWRNSLFSLAFGLRSGPPPLVQSESREIRTQHWVKLQSSSIARWKGLLKCCVLLFKWAQSDNSTLRNSTFCTKSLSSPRWPGWKVKSTYRPRIKLGFVALESASKIKILIFFATSFRWELKITNEASDWSRADLGLSFRFDPCSQPIGSQRIHFSTWERAINLADPSLERSHQMLHAGLWMSSIGQLYVDFWAQIGTLRGSLWQLITPPWGVAQVSHWSRWIDLGWNFPTLFRSPLYHASTLRYRPAKFTFLSSHRGERAICRFRSCFAYIREALFRLVGVGQPSLGVIRMVWKPDHWARLAT